MERLINYLLDQIKDKDQEIRRLLAPDYFAVGTNDKADDKKSEAVKSGTVVSDKHNGFAFHFDDKKYIEMKTVPSGKLSIRIDDGFVFGGKIESSTFEYTISELCYLCYDLMKPTDRQIFKDRIKYIRLNGGNDKDGFTPEFIFCIKPNDVVSFGHPTTGRGKAGKEYSGQYRIIDKCYNEESTGMSLGDIFPAFTTYICRNVDDDSKIITIFSNDWDLCKRENI